MISHHQHVSIVQGYRRSEKTHSVRKYEKDKREEKKNKHKNGNRHDHLDNVSFFFFFLRWFLMSLFTVLLFGPLLSTYIHTHHHSSFLFPSTIISQPALHLHYANVGPTANNKFLRVNSTSNTGVALVRNVECGASVNDDVNAAKSPSKSHVRTVSSCPAVASTVPS